jgi:hypothetical protein
MLPQKVKKGRKNCSILTPAGKFRHALSPVPNRAEEKQASETASHTQPAGASAKFLSVKTFAKTGCKPARFSFFSIFKKLITC